MGHVHAPVERHAVRAGTHEPSSAPSLLPLPAVALRDIAVAGSVVPVLPVLPVLPVVRDLMDEVMRSRAFTPAMWKTLDVHFDSISDGDLRALLAVIGRYATG